MGQEPDTIREDIEATRVRMSEKADALAYKSDVPARSKDKLHEVTDRMKEKVTGVLPSGGTKNAASDKAHDMKDATGERARKARGLAESNPIGLAVGALAAGFLAGLAIPSTRLEDEKLGPVADDLKSRAAVLGSEALDRGKEVASAATDAAKEAASDSAAEQKDGFAESAADQAEGARHSAPL